MALNSVVRARVDSSLKVEVEEIFKSLGINTSQAINMFLTRVRSEGGIPFELKVPNEKTLSAMREAKNMDGFVSSTLEELKEERNAKII